MRQLWLQIPPFLADTFGFEEVVNKTAGLGILDDCSDYKGRAGRLHSERRNGQKHMISTGIRMEDTVSGTGKKIKNMAEVGIEERNPDFIMLATGPVSAMIGTDLENLAKEISERHHLPVTGVELTGHKYYDVGIGRTLEKLADMVTTPMEKVSGTCNLLGGNEIDCGENVEHIYEWVNQHGYKVISQWGGQEATGNLRRAASAEINIVTAVCGIPVARYLKKKYGTPFVTGVPYGKTWSNVIFDAMCHKKQPEALDFKADSAKILIIGEQLAANAIRETLIRDFHRRNIQVATFFQLDKEFSYANDKKVKGEDDLKKLLNQGKDTLIIGAPEFKRLWEGNGQFIELSHGAVTMNSHMKFPQLVGEDLNQWLKDQGVLEGLECDR